jgi:hypothetical protein
MILIGQVDLSLQSHFKFNCLFIKELVGLIHFQIASALVLTKHPNPYLRILILRVQVLYDQ